MIATIKRPCPRCPDPIEPGQVMVPMPLGWTHAGCVEAAGSQENKGNQRGLGGAVGENRGTSESGPRASSSPAVSATGEGRGPRRLQGVD